MVEFSESRHQTFVILGHSHIAALIAAAAKRGADKERFRFVELQREPYKPAILRKREGDYYINPAVEEELRRARESAFEPRFVLTIGGAFHNVLALANHPKPYYVMGPWFDYAPAGERLITFNMMKEIMREKVSWQLQVIRLLGAALPRPACHLQPPPPVQAEDRIKRAPGVYEEVIGKFGVMPAEVRYTAWRIQSELMEEACRENDIGFIRVPRHALDDRGFLLERASRDPTHGNAWYGEQVLQQIERLFEVPVCAS